MNDLPINEIRLAQFRAQRDLELKDCGRINLLVGANNSGKTSVLDAISLFCRPLDIGNWREVAWRREVKSARTPLTEPFKWLFPQFLESDLPRPHSIWIYGKGTFPGRRLMAEYSEIEVFGDVPEEPEESQDMMVQEEGEPEQGLEIRALADFAIKLMGQFDEENLHQNSVDFKVIDNQRFTYSTKVDPPAIECAFISPVTHRTSQDTTHFLSQALRRELGSEDVRQAVTEIMREIDPAVQKFEIVDTGKTTSMILIKHQKTGMTPLSAFGDGMRRALLIAAIIPAVRNGVLLIDEIETALHASVFKSVLRVLRWASERYNVQVFATTHSLEAVDGVLAAFKDHPDLLVSYRLRQDGEFTKARRMSGETLKEMRYEGGLDIR